MFKFVILGIIFIAVFLAFYLTVWKYILKPMKNDESIKSQNDIKTNVIQNPETTKKEGNK